MRRFICSLLLLLPLAGRAQDTSRVWTLQQCVNFALEHNISIQQNVLNERLAALQLQQSKLSQLPNANVSTGYGRSYGRSIDPTTNAFADANYDFLSLSGNADVLLFGWFQRRNTIRKNDLTHQASIADVDQLRDDVSLNVATGFLRALLAKEQISVNEKQVSLSAAQLDQTKKFAEAGRLPELNVAQLEAQLSGDSARLISAIADYTSALLDMKALLNLDFRAPFDIVPPDVKEADPGEVLSHTPEDVYAVAATHFGSIRGSILRVEAAQKGVSVAKASLYPQLGLNAQVGSNYATTFKSYSNPVITGQQATGGYTDVSGTQYPIYEPTFTYTSATTPLGRQVSDNLRQTYSVTLNIPIFNAWQGQESLRQARINVQSQELNKAQAELTLQQNVYKAYNDARNAIQKYAAAERAAVAAQRAYDFAKQRYDLGLTSTVDYLTTQNTQYSADANALSAKYDLIFRLKVIDYYLGKELKL